MAVKNIVLVRHGRTAYNAAMRLQGQVDIPLDDIGRWQAAEAAKVLAQSPLATPFILASDLERARDTARVIGDALGVEVHTDARLRERGFGPWEGLTRPEIEEKWPGQYALWAGGGEPNIDGLEDKNTVGQRAADAILEVANSDIDARDLVVVSHGAAISCIIAHLLDQEPSTWRGLAGMRNVHWSVMARNTADGAQPAWRLIEHNAGPSMLHGPDVWAEGPDALQ
ncbi:histidine phosphatase family protein [Jonesia denitrificans]|uniref:Phosphoglycerate mutase n=1 Tax=Jonesia denitrificans (strain ATCC 14870 / DSM 20603 / BCRC 15368 / CIP 55.134 / JCM 11481 / NBRC 15587 / NCTC 10816 / Prevot 55134) TaxID=471856 RepID=C7R5L5_JONDD|nr:histidine phosphatase family protein [Jonesia denitrificans]ACV09288.1 Phosphoglycerate mutase [Jonesia denitrificans DSM 20603]SQH21531.1 Phosphoglyceromutase [Jonesia denitrificans]